MLTDISPCSHLSKIKKNIEIADIFRDVNLSTYSREQQKVARDILACRTSKLGGHVLKCDHCGHIEQSYNSCRNRHCPKCQSLAKARWLDNRMKELLPIRYFHVVFTIPDQLNGIMLYNKKILFDILFRSVKETLLETAANPKNIGAKIGFLSILHTWGQKLLFHPHVHCVVTGGGLSDEKKKWIKSKGKNFFIAVKKLSRLFKAKFIYYLQDTYNENKLLFYGQIHKLRIGFNFNMLIHSLKSKEWVVYAKKPFGGPEKVLRYLGKYTHRIAISNQRLVSFKEGKVIFKWKDYKDNCKQKTIILDQKEFIRRFFLHIVPSNFFRIRNYGFLSNRTKKQNIEICCKILNTRQILKEKKRKTWQELLFGLTGVDPNLCCLCKKGKLVMIELILSEKERLNKRWKLDSS